MERKKNPPRLSGFFFLSRFSGLLGSSFLFFLRSTFYVAFNDVSHRFPTFFFFFAEYLGLRRKYRLFADGLSPPPRKPAISFSERFMASRHEEGCYSKTIFIVRFAKDYRT